MSAADQHQTDLDLLAPPLDVEDLPDKIDGPSVEVPLLLASNRSRAPRCYRRILRLAPASELSI